MNSTLAALFSYSAVRIILFCFAFSVAGFIDGEELDRQEDSANASYCFNVYSGLSPDTLKKYDKLCEGDRPRRAR